MRRRGGAFPPLEERAMPSCYWKQCDCPVDGPNPCRQHQGLFCGLWSGQRVTSIQQVNDGYTAGLEAVLQGLQSSEDEISRLKVEVEQLKADMERENAEIENLRNSANDYGSRRALLEKVQETADKLQRRRDRMIAVIDAADMSFQQNSVATIMQQLSMLNMPYRDRNGYCACHQAKVAQLARLEASISANLVQLQQLELVTIPALKTMARNAWLALVPPALAGIIFVIKFVFYLLGLLAGPPGFVLLIIGLAVAAVLLLAAAIYYLSKLLEAMLLRRTIVSEMLRYYRLQQISVCQLAVPEEPGDDEGGGGNEDDDEHGHGHGSEGSSRGQRLG